MCAACRRPTDPDGSAHLACFSAHFFRRAVQFSTTLIGGCGGCPSVGTGGITNFWPSAVTSQLKLVRTAGARGRVVLSQSAEDTDRNGGCERRRIAHLRDHHGPNRGCQKKQFLAVASPPRRDAAAARDRPFAGCCPSVGTDGRKSPGGRIHPTRRQSSGHRERTARASR